MSQIYNTSNITSKKTYAIHTRFFLPYSPYRIIYRECRNSLKKFKISTTFNSQDWTWQSAKIFQRLDNFIERLHELKELFNTGRDFMKLDKIVAGGLKGRQISYAIEKIVENYKNFYRDWTNIQYNPLDPEAENSIFGKDRESFKKKTDMLERMIASQFEKALVDSRDLLLGGTILLRPIIREHIDPFMTVVVDDFEKEIFYVKEDFNILKQIYTEKGISVSKMYIIWL